jgi:NADH-quinone oxidoreductase subunit L
MDPHLPWFILINPLVAAVLVHLVFRRSPGSATFISVGSACFGLIAAIGVWFSQPAGSNIEVPWLSLGDDLRIPIGFTVDSLSKVMLLVVTGIGALVHVYSTVYMASDDSKSRYFGNLSLFMFSMLGIVLANNFAMMFIFWELVGLSSYLLIGHWFSKETAAAAANKAFITNRIGDFGFMLGILMLWAATGTVVFPELSAKLPELNLSPGYLTAAALLIFCGTLGKSAQLPLHVWLPDAMEGPTPVSALIHAATMVAAGVYMLARSYFLFEASPSAQEVIAWIGILTAVMAALIATQQDDIKRILAYSTLSQLGYMVSAVGLAAPDAAMFHLFTHAFFKALLFLGAGTIIHALHHEQDIWKMGGLSKKMRLTFACFVMGYLALIGCPGLSGFFSKDLILLAAWNSNKLIFLLALLTAFLTAYYMTRLVVVVFLGSGRSHATDHAHDGPVAMGLPLLVLAVLSVIAGWGTEPYFAHSFEGLKHPAHSGFVLALAVSVFLLGTLGAWKIYAGKTAEPIRFLSAFKNKFYFDELYAALIACTHDLLARGSAWADKWILDSVVVRGLSGATWGSGFMLRFLQVGNLQAYSFLFGVGIVILVYLLVFRN